MATDHTAQTPQAERSKRFREQLGTHYAQGADTGHTAGRATFDTCPHPDCVAARSATEAPPQKAAPPAPASPIEARKRCLRCGHMYEPKATRCEDEWAPGAGSFGVCGGALVDVVDVPPAPVFDFLAHLARQRAWSGQTFGPGPRTAGVVDHIRKELREIEADPSDISEWIDVVILALDGAWRAGYQPQQIIDALTAKQAKNEARDWPDWRTMPADRAIEHVRSMEPAPASVPPSSEEQCPHGEDCACAISTRHKWFEAFCQEREKARASSPAVPPKGTASRAWFQSLLDVAEDAQRKKVERLQTIATEMRRCLESIKASPAVPPSGPSAGDLLIAAYDRWAQHGTRCDLDECPPCVTLINQLRLAHKVWQSSAHKASAAVPPPPTKTEEETKS